MSKATDAALKIYPEYKKGYHYDLCRNSIVAGYEIALEDLRTWLNENGIKYCSDQATVEHIKDIISKFSENE